MRGDTPTNQKMETRKRNVANQTNEETEKRVKIPAKTPEPSDLVLNSLLFIAISAFSLLFLAFVLAMVGPRLFAKDGRGNVLCSAPMEENYSCPVTQADIDNLKEGNGCTLPDTCSVNYKHQDTFAHVRMVDRKPVVNVVNYRKMSGKEPKRSLLIGPTGSNCALPIKNISIVSTDPYVIVIDGFITDNEADHVKAAGYVSFRS
jgi:hypothetical protein